MSEEEIKIECSNDVFKYTPDQTYDYIYELQQENSQLKEQVQCLIKQRDDTNKSAVETIEKFQQENSQLKEDIKGLQCERQTLYNTIHDLKKANKQLNIKIDRGINKIEKAQKIIEVPTYPENIYLMRE